VQDLPLPIEPQGRIAGLIVVGVRLLRPGLWCPIALLAALFQSIHLSPLQLSNQPASLRRDAARAPAPVMAVSIAKLL
jgi:hypothetical protein